MSIDTRTLSALIKLQLAPSLDFASPGFGAGVTGTDGGSLFDMLLQQYMSESGSSAAAGSARTLSASAAIAALPLPLSDTAASLDEQSAVSVSSSRVSGLTYDGTNDYSGLIEAAARKYGLDPALIESVVRAESGFRPDAQSSAGAKGLMQLMDATARSLGVTDSFDPEQNIDAGTRYLSYLMRKYDGNEQVAVAAYNAGPGTIDRLGIRTNEELRQKQELLPQETRKYVAKVLGGL
ncbi:lytic transglycosylase domain-containing protein [Paenibacillus thailandensis]|uniref:Lytic transglycosylase domain-containing protein n=1 Tax=Paenibacillus thailandensis TaxID=393250 RepID=A0ABW5QYN4_9BACL